MPRYCRRDKRCGDAGIPSAEGSGTGELTVLAGRRGVNMNAARRTLALAAGLAFALALGACGGSSGPNCNTNPTGAGCPPPPTTLPACTQSVVESGSGAVEASTFVFHDFSVPDSGRLDTTVDWTNASSNIGVFVVPASTCALDEFNARSCNFLVRSEPSSVKPRKISTPNFAAGNYRWLIANFSDNESISFQFVLSKGSCAALTGGQPTAFSGGDQPSPIRRAIHF
jgi:hypothetical protein